MDKNISNKKRTKKYKVIKAIVFLLIFITSLLGRWADCGVFKIVFHSISVALFALFSLIDLSEEKK